MKKLHVRRIFAFLLSLMMLINLCIPMNVQAAEEVAQQTVKEVEIQVNESVKLTASGWSFMTTWESSDSSIVTVTNKGVITGMAEGTATVTATSKGFFFGNKKTEYLVHVTGEELPEIPETETPETEVPETETPETEVPETEESSDVIKVKIGETITLTAPEGTTTWSTSDTSVAEVSSNGVVTGVAEGTAVITATTKTGGFKFWFIQWGGKTVTTTYTVKVEAGETEAPETEAPETEAPETEAPETEAPETEVPETEAPETEAPETEAPETEAPETEAPETYIYDTTDTDGDELYDWIEEYHGTDTDKDDTDADGLTDFEEIYVTLTDPVKFDSIGEGSSDAEYDFDEDGLKNSEEVLQGSDPYKADTDADTLNDADEILQGTDPADSDTDKDGMPDGIEIPYGMNPLEPDTLNDGILDGDRQFKVSVENDEAFNEYGIRTTVKLPLHGSQIQSLSIDKIDKNDKFLSDKVPGFLGNAFEYTVDGTFDTAEISYEFPEELLSNPDFEPAIFYFDEEEQILTPLENQIVSGNTVIAQTTHFSKYILLNKKEFVKVWNYEIKFDSSEESYSNVDVAFVIDSSGSMTSNDGDNVRKSVTKNFISKLSASDRGAVIDFDSSARVYSGLTSDKEALSSAVDRIDSSGGTDLSVGIQAAIDLFTSSSYVNNDSLKIIIMLTDGDGTYSTNLTQTAKNNGIVIYTVGLGNSVSVSKLKEMAEGTTGNYYPASDAEKLYGIFDDIAEEADLKKDSDSDGVNDYFEKEMNAGRLRLGTGVPLLGMDYQDDDSDDDTLKDGDEISVKKSNLFQKLFNIGTEKIYVKLYSNPTCVDTDGDGMVDSEDEKPLYPFSFKYLGSPEHLSYVEARINTALEEEKVIFGKNNIIRNLGIEFLMKDYYAFLAYKGIKNAHGLAGVDYEWKSEWDKYWNQYCDKINEYVNMGNKVEKDLHYFRNNLNRHPMTLKDMLTSHSEWTLLKVGQSVFHMNETEFSGDGLFNLKFISNDGKYEAVYINSYGNTLNSNAGSAATVETDPINMGTYNFNGKYVNSGTFSPDGLKHYNLDVRPYNNYGNASPGDLVPDTKNEERYTNSEAAQTAREEFLTHWNGNGRK